MDYLRFENKYCHVTIVVGVVLQDKANVYVGVVAVGLLPDDVASFL